MFDSFMEGDRVESRGLCVAKYPNKQAVFSRVNSLGTRVFDVVNYARNERGAQAGTYYDVRTAKIMAKAENK